MIETFSFKKFTGEKLENVEQYVKEYCKEHGNIDVMVGPATSMWNVRR